MDLMPFEAVRDFLRLYKEKASFLLELSPQFVECFQAHLLRLSLAPNLNPVLPESLPILFEGRGPGTLLPTLDRRALHPLLPATKDVMIRERQEVIPLLLVPIDHHIGKIIPITPERMGMGISLEPGQGFHFFPFLRAPRPKQAHYEAEYGCP